MAFPTTGILDSFASSGTPPDASWTTINGFTETIRSVGGTCRPQSSTAAGGAMWNPTTFGPDSEVYTTIVANGNGSATVVLYLRLDNVANNGYRVALGNMGGGGGTGVSVTLSRIDTGSLTSLNTGTMTIVNSDVVGLGVVGNVLNVYRNGSSVLSYDTTPDGTKYTGAGNIGIGAFCSNDGTLTWDDFGGGTVSAVGGTPWDKLVVPFEHPTHDIIEFGPRAYAGYGNPPASWTTPGPALDGPAPIFLLS